MSETSPLSRIRQLTRTPEDLPLAVAGMIELLNQKFEFTVTPAV